VYLQKGYPISTGIIESTCGNLVKDRMEELTTPKIFSAKGGHFLQQYSLGLF
jgi:hypothetical protein